MAALAGGQHQGYVNDSSSLARAETIADGNEILGHIFGSKDVSRQVASRVAAQTGIGESVLKGMLPVVAAMMMGSMSKQAAQPSGLQAGAGSGAEGLIGMLTRCWIPTATGPWSMMSWEWSDDSSSGNDQRRLGCILDKCPASNGGKA